MPALDPLDSYASRTAARARSRRLGVREHRDQRWLVRDQGDHVVGIGRHERERGHRAAAAREHVDRTGAERLDQGVHVVRLDRGRIVDAAVSARAAAEAARVVGDDRAVGEIARRAWRSPRRSSADRSSSAAGVRRRWAAGRGRRRRCRLRRSRACVLSACQLGPGARSKLIGPAAGHYRRIRGSPKCGKTLLSPNQVIAEIRSPSSVRTSSAYGRAISVCGLGK